MVTLDVDPDLGSGDIFLTPRNSRRPDVGMQHGPMILDGRGRLVWFRNIRGGLAMNLEVQRYQGQPVLTWWQGTADFRVSEDVIADSSYRTLAVLRAGNGHAGGTDPHEFQITPQGTALIDATGPVNADLRAVGGPGHGAVQDDIVQELDIRTGRVLWEWHSYGHVPIRATYLKPYGSTPFDYFHLNSIQQLPDGNLLVSARNTWAVYEINRQTGNVMWTLGGKDSSFGFGPGARFAWQHDARLADGMLSLFDDASDGPLTLGEQSSAKLLRLDRVSMTATLISRYTHSPPLLALSQGNAQRLPNGDLFVGWGDDPQFSEYSASGRQLLDGSFALGVNTYRAYRFPWVGRPATRPALALSPTLTGRARLYASWNGATQVAAWRVLGGTSPDALSAVTRVRKTGFETVIRIRSALPYLAVQALDSAGTVLGRSLTRPWDGS